MKAEIAYNRNDVYEEKKLNHHHFVDVLNSWGM